MHNKILRWLLAGSLLLSSYTLLAAGLVATVDENTIVFGQHVQLKLQLDDAKARDAVDLSPLSKDFMIYSQQQFSTYSNNNGVITAESGWNVILMPKKAGEFVIPPLNIVTNKGTLKSNPIKITVQAATDANKDAVDQIGISLVSTVNKAKLFVNEPAIYTLKIISYKPIANVVLDDIRSNDAIVEKIGEPKQYDQAHGGVRAHIIEIRYSVTALKPGKISIAPATMHGELQISTQPQRAQRFGLFNNIFMDNMYELRPFSLQSEAITLEVVSPPVKANNWLPLNNLTLTQSWDGVKDVKAGDTITRKVKMVASGSFAKQLPSVKDYMPQDNVKVYANKPNYSESFDANRDILTGIKEEEFSIVPQQAGNINFPEIRVEWWNLRTKKMEVATLPGKTITVQPGTGSVAPGVTLDYSDNEQPQQIVTPETKVPETNKSMIVYVVLGVLVGILCTLGLIWTVILVRKRIRKIRWAKPEPEIVVKTVDDLRQYILQYARKHWQVAAGVTLNRLGDALANNNYTYDIELYTTLSQYINAGIYARVAVELDILLAQWDAFKTSVVKNKTIVSPPEVSTEDYSSLNPT